MYRVGITGSYGGCNLGDEAILHSMVAQLRASNDVELTVFTGNVADTLHRHRVERAVRPSGMPRAELVPEIEGLDLLLVGGGGILFDHWLKEHLREAQFALEKGVPVMVYAVGAGPLNDAAVQERLRDVLERSSAVTVRDQRSKHTLEKLGIERDIDVTADPGLLLEAEPVPSDALKREGIDGRKRLVGMSVREPGPAAPDIDVDSYHRLLAASADYMVDRFDAHVVFVPMEPQVQDMQHSHAVIAKMYRPQRATVLKGDYTSGQLLAFVRHFAFAVGMRLHFLVFAALEGVPFVALPYASKVMGFIEDLNMETPPLANLTVGQLLAYIDRSWDRKDALRGLIERGLPSLQERARETDRVAGELLRSREPIAARSDAGA